MAANKFKQGLLANNGRFLAGLTLLLLLGSLLFVPQFSGLIGIAKAAISPTLQRPSKSPTTSWSPSARPPTANSTTPTKPM
jgi:hypothetical protein